MADRSSLYRRGPSRHRENTPAPQRVDYRLAYKCAPESRLPSMARFGPPPLPPARARRVVGVQRQSDELLAVSRYETPACWPAPSHPAVTSFEYLMTYSLLQNIEGGAKDIRAIGHHSHT